MILNQPYFRFCQIVETITRRLLRKQKFDLEIKELVAKFLASIFVAGSFLTKEGKTSLIRHIDNFTLLKKEKEEKEEEKLPPSGSYETLMKFFGGKK